MARVTVNGVELYYEWHGPQDAPVLVLLNGVLMSTASWAGQLPDLARHYRVLLHDCRGQGQSAHPAEPYSMAGHADDLLALLDALAVRQAHVAGIAYGGEIALIFAARHPERVLSLFVSSAVSEVWASLRARVENWIAAAQTGRGELLYRSSVADNYSEPYLAARPGFAAAAIPRFERLDLPAVVNLCRSFLNLDCTAELAQISAPTSVVVGELDALKPLPYARLIAGRIEGARLLILAGAGHACSIETPAAWNACLLGHLALCQAQQKPA
jgi:pimeloyl-ACP methyl ester carboxylesterase